MACSSFLLNQTVKLLYAIWSWHHWQAWECLHWCRYLENVPAIVPLLEKEYRNAAARLESTQDELNDLHPDKYAPPHLVLQHLLCSYWHDGPASDRLSHCRAQGSSAVHTMMHNSHRISQFAQIQASRWICNLWQSECLVTNHIECLQTSNSKYSEGRTRHIRSDHSWSDRLQHIKPEGGSWLHAQPCAA